MRYKRNQHKQHWDYGHELQHDCDWHYRNLIEPEHEFHQSYDVQPKYEFQHQLDEQHHTYEPDSRGSVCARRHEQTAHWCHYYSEYNTSPNDSATPVLKSDGHEHRKRGAVLPLSTFCKAQTLIVSLERSVAVGQPSAIVKSGESR